MAETVADTRQALHAAEVAAETSSRERDAATAATARVQQDLRDLREEAAAHAAHAAQAAGEAMVERLVDAATASLDTAAAQMEAVTQVTRAARWRHPGQWCTLRWSQRRVYSRTRDLHRVSEEGGGGALAGGDAGGAAAAEPGQHLCFECLTKPLKLTIKTEPPPTWGGWPGPLMQ
jgi:hypothetical protein